MAEKHRIWSILLTNESSINSSPPTYPSTYVGWPKVQKKQPKYTSDIEEACSM